MSIFFGTDGIRGVVGQDLTGEIAFACGNSLSKILDNKGKVLIAKDTRVTGDFLFAQLVGGLLNGGIDVTFIGIAPTSCVSYLTKKYEFDFGIMLTASHNPAEYNGIKIFNSEGEKLSELKEESIEREFLNKHESDYRCVGRLIYKPNYIKEYVNYIVNAANCNLSGRSIVLDCANGASYKVASLIFKRLGAEVYKLNCRNDGLKINKNCGALYPEKLVKKTIKYKADFGFAFDGDADRIVIVDETGRLIDGDKILYGLAVDFAQKGILSKNKVVGTSMTNRGIELALKERGITLLRADVGDKYVSDMMNKKGLNLGGEGSGHIILKDFLETGDGILSAGIFAALCVRKNVKASDFANVSLSPQYSVSIEVKNKYKILKSQVLKNAIAEVKSWLLGSGRVLVRASGTEPKIRVMVECENENLCKKSADYLAEAVKQGDV